jgi:heme exporter protein CcmD
MGPYAVFVWSAYAAAGLSIGGLVLYAVLDYRAQTKALAQLQGTADRPDV